MCSNIMHIEKVYLEVEEVTSTKSIVTFYIVMEYAKHGTLL